MFQIINAAPNKRQAMPEQCQHPFSSSEKRAPPTFRPFAKAAAQYLAPSFGQAPVFASKYCSKEQSAGFGEAAPRTRVLVPRTSEKRKPSRLRRTGCRGDAACLQLRTRPAIRTSLDTP
jgi:hypothetical protein